MDWPRYHELRPLWLDPPPADLSWDRVTAALSRAGVEVRELPDYRLLLGRRGRMALFQHAAPGTTLWRYQARLLREFLDGPEPTA